MKRNETIKKAQTIRKEQKQDYKRIFQSEMKRKGITSKNAAISAGNKYRDKYGRTATDRWLNALEEAKRSINKAIKVGKTAKKSAPKAKKSATKSRACKTGQMSLNFKGVTPKKK